MGSRSFLVVSTLLSCAACYSADIERAALQAATDELSCRGEEVRFVERRPRDPRDPTSRRYVMSCQDTRVTIACTLQYDEAGFYEGAACRCAQLGDGEMCPSKRESLVASGLRLSEDAADYPETRYLCNEGSTIPGPAGRFAVAFDQEIHVSTQPVKGPLFGARVTTPEGVKLGYVEPRYLCATPPESLASFLAAAKKKFRTEKLRSVGSIVRHRPEGRFLHVFGSHDIGRPLPYPPAVARRARATHRTMLKHERSEYLVEGDFGPLLDDQPGFPVKLAAVLSVVDVVDVVDDDGTVFKRVILHADAFYTSRRSVGLESQQP